MAPVRRAAGGEVAVAHWREQAPADGVEDEERQWVRATLDGDLAAFDRLIERHWRKVASVVGRFLTDPNDVDDTVQETFVRAFESLRGFRGEASVRTWLLRIALNACRSKRGEYWRRRVTLTEDDSAFDGGVTGSPALAEAVVLQAEWEHALRAALRRLPEKLRLPIVLHFFEELSGAEIAAVLGWNQSTVWSRIYAGCRLLRKSLTDYREP
jgi:RNA polymerase sigma-70 factor (ECF subfamily)